MVHARLVTLLCFVGTLLGALPTCYGQASVNPGVASRLPLPDAAELRRATTTFREVYGADLAAARNADRKGALAGKFLTAAAQAENAADIYVLATEAKQLALAAGQILTLSRAFDQLTDRLQVDRVAVRLEAWTALLRAGLPKEKLTDLGNVVEELYQSSLKVGDFNDAVRVAEFRIEVLRRFGPSSAAAASDRAKATAELRDHMAAVQIAADVVNLDPEDSEANLVLGRHFCFTELNAPLAQKYLAKGSDPQLRALAEHNPPYTAPALEIMAAGDAWYDAAQEQSGEVKKGYLRMAEKQYERTGQKLSNLEKLKVAKRKREIRDVAHQDTDTSNIRWFEISYLGAPDKVLLPVASLPFNAAAERACGIWIAGLRGGFHFWRVELRQFGEVEDGSMPAQEWRLLSAKLRGKKVADTDLAHLATANSLRLLDLAQTDVGGAGLKHLAASAGYLHSLNLDSAPVGDDALPLIALFPNLQVLNLRNAKVSDAGLAALAQLKHLRALSLDGVPISDVGLAHLSGLTKLHTLRLRETSVTADGAAQLQAALKDCKISR
jgi:hypothetical protein